MIIEEDLYDHEFCEKYTHGFKELAEHVHKFTPEWAEPITWVPADKIRAAARLFATVKPAMLEWGCAIEHTPNTIQTIRALSMIPAITGNIDVPGGWIFGMKGAGRFPSLIENLDPEVEKKRLGYEKYKMLCGEGADLPACHIPTLIDAMLTGVPYRVEGVPRLRQQHADDVREHEHGLQGAHEARLHGLRRSLHDADGRARRHRAARRVLAGAEPDLRAADDRGQRGHEQPESRANG